MSRMKPIAWAFSIALLPAISVDAFATGNASVTQVFTERPLDLEQVLQQLPVPSQTPDTGSLTSNLFTEVSEVISPWVVKASYQWIDKENAGGWQLIGYDARYEESGKGISNAIRPSHHHLIEGGFTTLQSASDPPPPNDPNRPSAPANFGATVTNTFQQNGWEFTITYEYGVRNGVQGWHTELQTSKRLGISPSNPGTPLP